MCEDAPKEIQILAKAPMMIARKYSSYTMNGLDFHIESYDVGRCVHNSGVALVAESACGFDFQGQNSGVR